MFDVHSANLISDNQNCIVMLMFAFWLVILCSTVLKLSDLVG